MRILTTLLLASVSLGALAHSAIADDAIPASQIRVVPYSPLHRTEIVGLVGEPTTITFPKGESVYRIVQTGKPAADGSIEDAGWQGPSAADVKETPLGNNLTLWPSRAGESTMSVITMSAEGVQKVYAFRMTAKPNDPGADEAPGVVLNLIFKGEGIAKGEGSPASAVASAAPRATLSLSSNVARVTPVAATARRAPALSWKAQQEEAKEKLLTDAFNGMPGECGYHAKGKKPSSIIPLCPMDNGQWTLMRFPGLSKKPAVYVVTGDDDERLARQHASGDFVVVEEIDPHFRLRLGDEVLDIIDDHYNPVGNDPGTGTIAPTVQRDVIPAKTSPRGPLAPPLGESTSPAPIGGAGTPSPAGRPVVPPYGGQPQPATMAAAPMAPR